jgi:hypothetical protein
MRPRRSRREASWIGLSTALRSTPRDQPHTAHLRGYRPAKMLSTNGGGSSSHLLHSPSKTGVNALMARGEKE